MPYFETAYLDAVGAKQSIGEYNIHYTGVRMRVIGSGQLDMTLYTQDKTTSQSIGYFTMVSASSISQFRLCNFNAQRAMLRVETDQIDEIFRINRIIIFTKPTAVEYPG